MKYRKNLEIKAPVKNLTACRKIAADYCKNDKSVLHYFEGQEDIYYSVKRGRLKLRIINGISGTLIYYNRSNKTGTRVSNYYLAQTGTPSEMDAIMTGLFGKLITINKKREIFISDNVRIHLDSVKGLGKYLEFEVIFNSINSAGRAMKKLINTFGLDEETFIKHSYSDLLIKKIKNAGKKINI
jgi:adenylate cyclase, class 2